MNRLFSRIQQTLVALTIGFVASVAILSTPTPALAATGGTCQNITLPVSLGAGLPNNQTIAGTLCTPTTWAEGEHTVDVLVHGATYSRIYWDWPMQPAIYSYVEDTLTAGRATFAYDRLGVGQSSRPLGALATVDADAHVLHQIITNMRTVRDYGQVNVVGHSLGSTVVIQEAASYQDVDRAVLTGIIHAPNILGLTPLATSFYPAMLDPAFFGLLDPTYLTTQPASRNIFYGPTADPAVIAYDEAHKDKVAAAGVAGAALLLQTPALLNISTAITAPVLVTVGANDTLLCAPSTTCASSSAITANEAPYFPNANSVTGLSLPATGHDIPLHPAAPSSFAAINTWIVSH